MKLVIPPGSTNVVQLLLRHGDHPYKEAAKHKVQGRWQSVTWGEILRRIRSLSEALVALGIQPGDRVCIWAQTHLNWCLADAAIMGAGAITVPIYASNTLKETEHIINDCGAKVVFFDNAANGGGPNVSNGSGNSSSGYDARAAARWQRLKEARPRIPSAQHFVAFDLASQPSDDLVALADLEEQGSRLVSNNPTGLEDRAGSIRADDLNCILYTSGTTGTPKGVMLTHASWIAQSFAVLQAPILVLDDLILLFLPLAHSFARLVEMAWLCQNVRIVFAESVERVVSNAAEVQPTILPAVPRFFEKAYNQVMADGMSKTGVEGHLFRWAMQLFEQHVAAREAGRRIRSPQWLLAKRLVFNAIAKKISTRFGGKMRLFVSGGASLSKKIGLFFEACGVQIVEGYGLTETCAPTHANRISSNKVGTVGLPIPGIQAKIAQDGELLVQGPQIMVGYYKLPNETEQVLEKDGWLHTGDIGEIDSDGMLRITDRKKDLIKTSGGKYVAPQELENNLKADPIIGQVSIHGEGRKFITALITISPETAKQWAQGKGIAYNSLEDICKRPELKARVAEAVDSLNSTLPSYATIKKFAILDTEWSQESGELTPTLKVRRPIVEQRYKAVIDKLYEPFEA